MRKAFRDKRGVEYVFDAALHCGARGIGTFCIVGPGHVGAHWDGEKAWRDAPVHCPQCAQERGVAIPADCPHGAQGAR
jgi:hypothetical protein